MRCLSVLLVWALGLGLTSSCGSKAASSGPPDGPALFSSNCAQCHAADGHGSGLGPALQDKGAHWTRERLAVYLVDPITMQKADPRLREQSRNYQLPMPSYKSLALEERLAIADHVLGLR